MGKYEVFHNMDESWALILVGGWSTPLKNMSSSVGMIIPNIWKNKINVPNHQPDNILLVKIEGPVWYTINQPTNGKKNIYDEWWQYPISRIENQ